MHSKFTSGNPDKADFGCERRGHKRSHLIQKSDSGPSDRSLQSKSRWWACFGLPQDHRLRPEVRGRSVSRTPDLFQPPPSLFTSDRLFSASAKSSSVGSRWKWSTKSLRNRRRRCRWRRRPSATSSSPLWTSLAEASRNTRSRWPSLLNTTPRWDGLSLKSFSWTCGPSGSAAADRFLFKKHFTEALLLDLFMLLNKLIPNRLSLLTPLAGTVVQEGLLCLRE